MNETNNNANDVFAGMTPEQINVAIGAVTESDRLNDHDVRRNPITGRIMSGGEGSDEALNVTFTTEAVHSKMESYIAKTPRYVDMEFIAIEAPGQRPEARVNIHTPVTDYYIWRFPSEYKQFKEGLTAQITGTPLSVWPAITPSFAKELANQGIRTIEQLAALSDHSAQSIRGFHSWKAKAQQFIDMAKDAGMRGQLQAQLDESTAANNAKVAAMEAQMAQLIKMLETKNEVSLVSTQEVKAAKAK